MRQTFYVLPGTTKMCLSREYVADLSAQMCSVVIAMEMNPLMRATITRITSSLSGIVGNQRPEPSSSRINCTMVAKGVATNRGTEKHAICNFTFLGYDFLPIMPDS